MDPWARLATPQQVMRYLPRALAVGFFAPFPWQWFETTGSTGALRAFASFEMALWYLLVPGLLGGVVGLLKQRRPEGFFVLTFILLTAIPISIVVANLGTLFRLRLLFLLPLLLVAAGGDPIGVYRRVFHFLVSIRSPRANGVTLAQEDRLLGLGTDSAAGTPKTVLLNAGDRPEAGE